MIKGIHAEHLQWDSMIKGSTAWSNMYGEGYLGMGYTIDSRDGKLLTATDCPTRGPWFGKFMRGSKMRLGVIKNLDFGITCKVVKALPEIW